MKKKWKAKMAAAVIGFTFAIQTVYPAAAAETDRLPEEVYDIASYYEDMYQYYRYHMDGYLWNDFFKNEENFSYIQFYKNRVNASEAFSEQEKIALSLIESSLQDAIITGDILELDSAIIQVYEASLIGLLLTIDQNEMLGSGNELVYIESGERKDSLDIVLEGIDAVLGTAGGLVSSDHGTGSGDVLETKKQQLRKLMDLFVKAGNDIDLSLDSTALWLDTMEEEEKVNLLAASERYEMFDELLTAIMEHTEDSNMRIAAENVLEAVNLTFLYRLNHVNDAAAETAGLMSGFFFGTMFDELLKNEEIKKLLTSKETALLNVIGSASKVISGFDTSRALGLFLSDIFVGASNKIINCYDIYAMVFARRAVLQEIGQIHSTISSKEDYEKIYQVQNMLKNLMYIDMRGEECIYQIVLADQGILNWYTTDTEKTEANYQKMHEVFSSVRSIADEILPNWSYYVTNRGNPMDENSWAGFYQSLLAENGSLGEVTLSYAGEDGWREAVRASGQGFSGCCLADLDQDGALELAAAGNWFQGSANGDGTYANDYTAFEIWVYDIVDGNMQATLLYHDAYCGIETEQDALKKIDVMVHVSGGMPYFVIRKEGQRPDSELPYYEISILRYYPDGAIGTEAAFSSRKAEISFETLAEEQRWNLAPYSLSMEGIPGENDTVIGSLQMNNQWEGGQLSSGSIAFLACEANIPALQETPESTQPESAAIPSETEPTVAPLTMDEVQQILTELGYQTVIVSEYNGLYSVMTYENTYLSYTMTVDPVSGIAQVGFQGSDGSMGSIDLRTKTVLSGSPLPVVPTSEAARFTEALSREYVEARMAEYGLSNYLYYTEDEKKYTFYDDFTLWYVEVYKYSGQILEHNYRGVIIQNFNLTD